MFISLAVLWMFGVAVSMQLQPIPYDDVTTTPPVSMQIQPVPYHGVPTTPPVYTQIQPTPYDDVNKENLATVTSTTEMTKTTLPTALSTNGTENSQTLPSTSTTENMNKAAQEVGKEKPVKPDVEEEKNYEYLYKITWFVAGICLIFVLWECGCSIKRRMRKPERICSPDNVEMSVMPLLSTNVPPKTEQE